jgi:hypothetical protein
MAFASASHAWKSSPTKAKTHILSRGSTAVRTVQKHLVEVIDQHNVANRNVWSASVSQAKCESDRLVCANVYDLCWSSNSWPGWNVGRVRLLSSRDVLASNQTYPTNCLKSHLLSKFATPKSNLPELPCELPFSRNLKWSDNQDMKDDAEILDSANERTSLLGVGVSAGLLVALGCLWGFYALFCIVILGITGVRAWKSHASTRDNPRRFATLLLAVIIMTALT